MFSLQILVIFRNPKDTAVSFFHFHNDVPDIPSYGSWDDFFRQFMKGQGMAVGKRTTDDQRNTKIQMCFRIKKETTGTYCIGQGTTFNILQQPTTKKNMKKDCRFVNIYTTELLHCTPETNTTL